MRTKSVAFLAASAVVLLASCTSAPRAPTLTVELFDSKAVHEQPVPVALPLPFVPVLSESEVTPARTAAETPPAASILSYDAGPTFPTRPRAKATFTLVAPTVPAPLTGLSKQAPARLAKPAPASTVSAAPTSSTPAPALASTAVPAPKSASASTSGSSGSPSGSASGSPNGAYGRLREIYARQGDVLQVGLDGVAARPPPPRPW